MKKTKKLFNRTLAFFMAMMVCVVCTLSSVTAQAATAQMLFENANGTFSSAGDTYQFSTNGGKDFYFEIDVADPSITVDIVLKSLDTGSEATGSISGSQWKLDEQYNIYWYLGGYTNLPAGNYELKVSSASTSSYLIYGFEKSALTISATSVSLSAGQTKTLTVSGTTETVKWSSSNTAVATVDSKGKVKAKKTGKATITATVGSEKLTCNITVKKPVISSKAFTITAGQKRTLKVTGKAGKVTWKSSKKSVAAVNSKGVVTAKKAGKAKITATVDGCKLTCTVTVKKNEYTNAAISSSMVGYGVWYNTTKVSYDKKGQLVCKVQILNNSANNVEELRNFRITVSKSNGSTIGTYTISKKKLFIYSGSSKTITITIPKSKVKQNADLRAATPKCSGSYVYRY